MSKNWPHWEDNSLLSSEHAAKVTFSPKAVRIKRKHKSEQFLVERCLQI